MNSPAERDSERKWSVFLEYYLTLNTLVQLPMWFICLIITAQLSNTKDFQIILRKAAAADQGLFYKVRENTFGNKWSFHGKLLRIHSQGAPYFEACSPALCSQKQIKTSDTKRTLMAMITAVWGQTTNWSTFKGQERDMRHRSWIPVLQHSPAQVLLPGFSSVYSSPPPLLFPCVRKGQDYAVSSLLTAGMARRGSVHQADPAQGSKGRSSWAPSASSHKCTVQKCCRQSSSVTPALLTATISPAPCLAGAQGKAFRKTLLEWHYQQWPLKGAQWPPNLQYCHSDPMVLLRWVSKLPSSGDYERKKGVFW